MPDNISFDDVCAITGRLYIESNHQHKTILEEANKAIADLRTQNEKLTRERDEALKLWKATVPEVATVGPGPA